MTDQEAAAVVRAIVEEKPDLTDQEIAWEFHRRAGRAVSRSAMNRVHAHGGARAQARDLAGAYRPGQSAPPITSGGRYRMAFRGSAGMEI